MAEVIIIGLLCLGSFVLGALALFVYMVYRMMKNKGWDDSNLTNAFRLLSHVVMHPHDFGRMYYLSAAQQAKLREGTNFPTTATVEIKRPFWYVDKDELSEIVKTRP